MAAIEEPNEQALTIREAASACRVSPRTIRRRLNSGAFAGAYKVDAPPGAFPGEGAWRIPLTDLYRAGLIPKLAAENPTSTLRSPPESNASGITLQLLGSDRFARLRTELAEAVAAAEFSLVRAEVEKWRMLADERGRALDRADLALRTVAAATDARPQHNESLATRPHLGFDRAGAAGDIVDIPPSVRDEAVRYTRVIQAARQRQTPRRWWHVWR